MTQQGRAGTLNQLLEQWAGALRELEQGAQASPAPAEEISTGVGRAATVPAPQAEHAANLQQGDGGGRVERRDPKQRAVWIQISKDLIPAGWSGTPALDIRLGLKMLAVTANPTTLASIRGSAQDPGSGEYAIIASDASGDVELQCSVNAAYLKTVFTPNPVPEAVVAMFATMPASIIQTNMNEDWEKTIHSTATKLADAYPSLEAWAASLMEADLDSAQQLLSVMTDINGILGKGLNILGLCASAVELKKRLETVSNFATFISRPRQNQTTGAEHTRRFVRGEASIQAPAVGSPMKLEEFSATETRSLLQRFRGGKINDITADERILVIRLADKCKRDQGTGQGEIRALLAGLQESIRDEHGYQLGFLVLAAILVGNLSEEQVGLMIQAAGATAFHPMQQLEQVGQLLASVSKCTGIGGYEGADKLMGTFMKELAPLRQGEVNAANFQRIFTEWLALFGNNLYHAIHAKSALPDILKLPRSILNKLRALQVATEALDQLRRVQESEALHKGGNQANGKRPAEHEPEGEVRRIREATIGYAQGDPVCNSFLLGGKCTKANCGYKHVKGTPGVDKCPFGTGCNRKENCLLAWSHPE